jgi:penicillin-binding protein 1C
VKKFVELLAKSRFHQIEKDHEKLGLSLVLGGCGATLEELTKLYSAFASDGQLTAFNWVKNERDTGFVQVVSPEAAFILSEILTQRSRPDFPKEFENAPKLPKIAWKTGTSYGRRDAWSIGYNKKYTIGVWVGNFSGVGVPELTGASCATPLLFDIFNSIQYDAPIDWFSAPESLGFRYVCSETGMPPAEFCENQVIDYYLPTISTNQKCDHKKMVWISVDSQYSYCTSCLPEAGYIKKLFPNHSSEMVAYFEAENIAYEKLPPHNVDCERVFSENAPFITSPTNGLEYYVNKEENQKIMLSCQAANDVTEVFWYVDDRFIQSAEAAEHIFFQPKPGDIKISCTDDQGRNSDISIVVKYF